MHGRSDHQLGITEAGLFPGVSFYLTMWYRRHEVNFRIALFFSAATIAGAFGGLLARLINLMNDVAGLEGYVKTSITTLFAGRHRLFLGVPSTCDAYSRPDGAGSSSWREFSPLSWPLPRFGCSTTTPIPPSSCPRPRRWSLLSGCFCRECTTSLTHRRLALDSGSLSHEFKKKCESVHPLEEARLLTLVVVYDAFLDWKTWVLSFMYIGGLMPVYAFSLFSPTLIANLGYTAATAQLLSVPPYVLAALTTVLA